MIELAREIPDVAVLLELTPEELGAKLLFTMRKRMEDPQRNMMSGQGEKFLFADLESDLFETSRPESYSRQKQADVMLAFAEAWAWLEAQGLLVPATGDIARVGWRVLSRRARAIESEAKFAEYRVARLLPKEILHSKIADVVWGDFVRGRFDSAVLQAMKAVEVSVRIAARFGDELFGVALMRKAFSPKDGPLTDLAADAGERQGRADLFAGAMGSYKNSQSHRDVNLDNPLEALEIIYLANHLLRIVDARAKAREEKPL